jgi:hypothetical protein
VAGIFLKPGVTTPESIGIGSTVEELRAAYPDTREADQYSFAASVPGHPDRQYFVYVDENTKVAEMSLELTNQDCSR